MDFGTNYSISLLTSVFVLVEKVGQWELGRYYHQMTVMETAKALALGMPFLSAVAQKGLENTTHLVVAPLLGIVGL